MKNFSLIKNALENAYEININYKNVRIDGFGEILLSFKFYYRDYVLSGFDYECVNDTISLNMTGEIGYPLDKYLTKLLNASDETLIDIITSQIDYSFYIKDNHYIKLIKTAIYPYSYIYSYIYNKCKIDNRNNSINITLDDGFIIKKINNIDYIIKQYKIEIISTYFIVPHYSGLDIILDYLLGIKNIPELPAKIDGSYYLYDDELQILYQHEDLLVLMPLTPVISEIPEHIKCVYEPSEW